jgi:hypothetical protein
MRRPGLTARAVFEEAGVPAHYLDAMVRAAADVAPYTGGSERWAAERLVEVFNAYAEEGREKGADPP